MTTVNVVMLINIAITEVIHNFLLSVISSLMCSCYLSKFVAFVLQQLASFLKYNTFPVWNDIRS
jgi:hypothetical protein